MPRLIRAFGNANQPIVHGPIGGSTTELIYFNLVQLAPGESYTTVLAEFETVCVVMSGRCDITAGDVHFEGVGQRNDIWSGRAESVYAPPGAKLVITGIADKTEIAIAGGRCDQVYRPFRIAPEDVEMVEVGSNETKSRRRIFHILGANGTGRSGNLLVSELYADEGCWSGYPPHKHDTDRVGETAHEEVYHFRFRPETGFGGQFMYEDGAEPQAVMTRNGDTFAFAGGYHPTVTSPGHEEYILTILVGRSQRSLVQYFHPDQSHLLSKIPGIAAMRAKFLA